MNGHLDGIDEKAELSEREMRIAIGIYGNMKQLAALDCVLHKQPAIPKAQTLRRLERIIERLHDARTWQAEVEKRMKLIELGQ